MSTGKKSQGLTKDAAQKFFEFVARNNPIPIYLVREDGTFAFINKAACEHLGYTEEEMMAMGPPDMDPWYDVGEWPHHWREMKEKGEMTFESRHKARDGTIIPMLLQASFINLGKFDYICAFATDISDRIATRDNLREMTERFNRLVCGCNDTFYLVDDNGKIIRPSPAACRRLGYSEEEMKGRHIAEFLDPESAEIFRNKFREILKQDGVTCEMGFKDRSGKVFRFQCYPSVITDENDEITSVLIFERLKGDKDKKCDPE
jgi:PAS domain S-box-containing protein